MLRANFEMRRLIGFHYYHHYIISLYCLLEMSKKKK